MQASESVTGHRVQIPPLSPAGIVQAGRQAVGVGLACRATRIGNVSLMLGTGGYFLAFFFLFPVIETGAIALSIFPILLAAYCGGLRAGVAVALSIGLVINPLLLSLFEVPVADVVTKGLPGILGGVLMAGLVGRLRDVSGQLKQELASRQQAEATLRWTDYQYWQLFNAAGDAIFIFEPDTETILEANPRASELYGFDRSELIGKSLKELTVDVERGEAAIEQTLEEGVCCDLESIQLRKDGTHFHVLVSASVVTYQGRQAILTMNRDITARRKVEAALRKSEARFQELLRSLKEVVWSTTLDGQKIYYLNHAAEEVFGLPKEAMHARPDFWLDIIYEEDRERVQVLLPKLYEDGYNEIDYRIVRPDGEVRWVRNRASIIYDEQGRPSHLGGVVTDVTYDYLMDKALRESRDRYINVVNTVKDVVFQTDGDGRWTFLNAAWEEITGFTVEESLGQSILDRVYPEDRDRSLALFRRHVLSRHTHFRHAIRYRPSQGGQRWLEIDARLFYDEQGLKGTSGTLHDVTDRHEAMRVLETSLERERELGMLKSRFVSMASHELRTPLTAIKSSAELLQQFGERWDAERRQTLFNRIVSNVDTMTDLIDDVLLMGRADSGRLPFTPEQLDLRTFCQALIQEYRQGAGSRHRIILYVPSTPVEAEADPKLLRLVLGNLLSNACKYTPESTPINVQLSIDAEYVTIKVADQGIGIPEADMPRLFEPFHRASNVETRAGTGLGLTIAKRAIDLHQGFIQVKSAVDRGTTFTVKLPVEAVREPDVVPVLDA